MSEDDAAARWAWASGIPHEIKYWRKFLNGWKGEECAAELAARYDPERPFSQDVEDAITLPPGSTVRVLDVGAGPITSLGYRSAKYQISLTPIDALAEDYRDLIMEIGLEPPPVPTVQCRVEEIVMRFRPASFEVAHARNSLDHCPDPLVAICDMHDALAPGGLLYIRTYGDEGERRQYAGFHGWNFRARDGELILWRPGVQYNISQMFPGSRIIADPAEIVFAYTKP